MKKKLIVFAILLFAGCANSDQSLEISRKYKTLAQASEAMVDVIIDEAKNGNQGAAKVFERIDEQGIFEKLEKMNE